MGWIFDKSIVNLRDELASDRNDILRALAMISKAIRRIETDEVAAYFRLRNIESRLTAIEARLSGAATQFKLTQQGESMGAILGTAIGGQSVFAAAPLQADGVTAGTLQAGNIPAWSSTDANVTITASADGSQATVALAATETATTYVLTVSGINSDGNAISTSFTIPVLPAVVAPPPPPPDTAATQFGLSQLS